MSKQHVLEVQRRYPRPVPYEVTNIEMTRALHVLNDLLSSICAAYIEIFARAPDSLEDAWCDS